MKNLSTDVQKTLQALKNAGAKGIHSFHLNSIVGTTRSAARINDLKKLGYSISANHERMGNSWGVRYWLNNEIGKSREKKLIQWEFDAKSYTAKPVYG